MWTDLVRKVLQYLQLSHSHPQTHQRQIFNRPRLSSHRRFQWWSCSTVGGGSILASEGLLTVRGAVDQDWRALECIRANGLDNGGKLIRVTTGSQECLNMLREVRPDVVVGDARRRSGGIREKEGISGASSLAQAAIASDARVFTLESSGNLLRTTEWNDEILPALERESYIVDKAEILAIQVGIPWRRKRTFVVGIKGGLSTKGKFVIWKRRLEKVKQPVKELGEFLG